MNWDDLRFFLALAREGSVSGAGRALGVKHTTVARRILGFEERLGTRLFDRLSDGYAMTQVAEQARLRLPVQGLRPPARMVRELPRLVSDASLHRPLLLP